MCMAAVSCALGSEGVPCRRPQPARLHLGAESAEVMVVLQRRKTKRIVVAQHGGAAMHGSMDAHTLALQPVTKGVISLASRIAMKW